MRVCVGVKRYINAAINYHDIISIIDIIVVVPSVNLLVIHTDVYLFTFCCE